MSATPSVRDVDRETALLAFVLRCSADNPAAIGSQRKAVELLESLGIEPRGSGVIYHTETADLANAAAILRDRIPVSPLQRWRGSVQFERAKAEEYEAGDAAELIYREMAAIAGGGEE